jgi:hypothetical protein
MDILLFYTHFVYLFMSTLNSTYYDNWDAVIVALRVKSGYRILWFTSVKAVINTLMVVCGFKPRGHFKFTPKTGLAGEGEGQHVPGETVVLDSEDSPPSEEKAGGESKRRDENGVTMPIVKNQKKKERMYRTHAGISRVTEARKLCMPMDGTLDIWVLMSFLFLSAFSAAVGVKRLAERDALVHWNNNRDTLLWIGVIFAIVDMVPALLFGGCAPPSSSAFRASCCRAVCAALRCNVCDVERHLVAHAHAQHAHARVAAGRPQVPESERGRGAQVPRRVRHEALAHEDLGADRVVLCGNPRRAHRAARRDRLWPAGGARAGV